MLSRQTTVAAALGCLFSLSFAVSGFAQTTQSPLGKLSRLNNNLTSKPPSGSIDRPHITAGGVTKPSSASLAQPGWYIPKSSYSASAGTSGGAGMLSAKPGWYLPSGVIATGLTARQKVGWFTPKATANGDSSLALNRPGYYLPENMLADSSGMSNRGSVDAMGGQTPAQEASRLGGSSLIGTAAGLSNMGSVPPAQVSISKQPTKGKAKRPAAGRFAYNSRSRLGGSMPSAAARSAGRSSLASGSTHDMFGSQSQSMFGASRSTIGGDRNAMPAK